MLDAFVLVVDDNPDTLSLLETALDTEGVRAKTASSVLRAVESLHDGSPRPSLIITDLMMPMTTGWDFMKHLRTDAELKSLPIIVVTGADPGEGEQLADMVLRKPVDPLEVARTVRTMLTTRPEDR